MPRVATIAPQPVPSLDELAADPTRAAGLPVGVLRALLIRAGAVHATIAGALTVAAAQQCGHSRSEDTDVLIDIAAAAKQLSTTIDWLYRHSHELPFTTRVGRQLRFSRRGVERFIRERSGT